MWSRLAWPYPRKQWTGTVAPDRRGGHGSENSEKGTDLLRLLVHLAVWLLPASDLKNRLLRRFGHQIAPTARLGPTIVLGFTRFQIGDDCSFGAFNVFKGLSLVYLEDEAGMAAWNWISAAPAYQQLDPKAGALIMYHGARIEGRNYLDCSGTVEVGAYSAIGGQRCLLQTHEPQFVGPKQRVGRIVIGHHSLVGSCSVLLKGAELPPQSVLAAHSTMTGKRLEDPKPGVYAGTPAKYIAPTTGEWFTRTINPITDYAVDGEMGLISDRAPAGEIGKAPA